MRKVTLVLLALTLYYNIYPQNNCEQREDKLLEAMSTYSAGFLYNTYGLIGSVSDGFIHKVYDKETTINLLDAQKKLADNMISYLNNLKNDGWLKSEKDINYTSSVILIIDDLKKQALLMEEYIQTKKQKQLTAYSDQREKNWSSISKLMGVKE